MPLARILRLPVQAAAKNEFMRRCFGAKGARKTACEHSVAFVWVQNSENVSQIGRCRAYNFYYFLVDFLSHVNERWRRRRERCASRGRGANVCMTMMMTMMRVVPHSLQSPSPSSQCVALITAENIQMRFFLWRAADTDDDALKYSNEPPPRQTHLESFACRELAP